MNSLVFLLALMAPGGFQQDPQQPTDPNLQRYNNTLLGMNFNYPKAWEVTTNKKFESRFLIPIENTSDRAVVELFPVSFRSEPVVWQISQAGFNKTMKRAVERQWEEEILGVPLLLTKVNYTEKGSQRTSETGLVYTLGFNKMMYRVTASPAEFDKADYLWRQALQTLRTWDGNMPSKEDPSVKIAKSDPKAGGKLVDDIPHPTTPNMINAEPKIKPVKAPIAATIDLGGHKIELRLPSDWKADSNKDGSFSLHNAGVNGPVSVTLFAAAGSDPADIAMLKASAASLNDFVKVATRDEAMPVPNKAGALVSAVWRTGTGTRGDLGTCEAASSKGDYYFVLTYRTTNVGRWKAERSLLASFLDRASVESTP